MIQTFLFMDNGCLLLDKRCLPISTYSYSNILIVLCCRLLVFLEARISGCCFERRGPKLNMIMRTNYYDDNRTTGIVPWIVI